jgi:hypothetical protein
MEPGSEVLRHQAVAKGDCGQSVPGPVRQGMCMRDGTRAQAKDADSGSSGPPFRLRWRAEQELRGGEPFDDVHGSAADWTLP